MWVKTMSDGTRSEGPTVEGPGFYLGVNDREGIDGWVWVDKTQAAVVDVPQQAINQLAQDAALAETPAEYTSAVESFLEAVRDI